jgi:hypothetical protein
MEEELMKHVPQSVLEELAEKAKASPGTHCAVDVKFCTNEECMYNNNYTGSAQKLCVACELKEREFHEKKRSDLTAEFTDIEAALHAAMVLSRDASRTDEECALIGLDEEKRAFIKSQLQNVLQFIKQRISAFSGEKKETLLKFAAANMRYLFEHL